MSDFEFDTREIREAIKLYGEATGKDMVLVVNKAALQSLIGAKGVSGAVQLTPRADLAKIAAIPEAELRSAVITRAKKKGQWPMTRQALAKAVRQERARRKRSRGYTAGPGWNKAVKALGGRGVRGVQSGFEKSEARKGYATKAKSFRLISEFVNTAPAAAKIGRAALQSALNNVARDMKAYGEKKMAQTAAKYSAK